METKIRTIALAAGKFCISLLRPRRSVPLDMTVGGKRIRHRKNSGTEGNLLEFFFHMLQGLVSSFLT
jgi:hypothetical protein